MNTDYIYEENYLASEDCQKLIKYFEENVKPVSNVNSTFNNRVVYYESISDPVVKGIMKKIHEDVAVRLQKFYGESEPVLPEATHLVKWPVGSSLGNHADNAYEDGRPNYVSWRTYSAVVYLNDNYVGGEFYFKKYAYTLKPEVGLLVAFTGGLKHIHGVKEITYGTRYAMPMWFCSDRQRAYPEYR